MTIKVDSPVVVIPFPTFTQVSMPNFRSYSSIILIENIPIPRPYKDVQAGNFKPNYKRIYRFSIKPQI